jgi:hypothetical protein
MARNSCVLDLHPDDENTQISGDILTCLNITGLQDFLNKPNPGGPFWGLPDKKEYWENTRKELYLSRIYALVALLDVVKDIGWIEHTCDWDLGVTIKLKDGTEWQSEYGTEDIQFKCDDGSILTAKESTHKIGWFGKWAETTKTPSVTHLVVQGFEENENEDQVEMSKEFPIMEIDEIHIWS